MQHKFVRIVFLTTLTPRNVAKCGVHGRPFFVNRWLPFVIRRLDG